MGRKSSAQKVLNALKPWQKSDGTQGAKFITLHESFMDQKLWWDMKSSSRDVYLIMLRKYNGRNDQELEFPYDVVKEVISKPTFHNCIKELIENGYIEFVEHNRYIRKSNIYKFSQKWRNKTTVILKY